MIIQDDLKYNHTISKTIGKLQTLAHSLKYANKLLPRSTLRDLYFTHAYPHLIGNITVWGTADCRKTYIKSLAILQKKLIRLVCNVTPRTSTGPLMQQLKILNIYNLYTYRVAIEVHKFKYRKEELNRPQHNHYYTPVTQVHCITLTTHGMAAISCRHNLDHTELNTQPHTQQNATTKCGTPCHQASEQNKTLQLLKSGSAATS